MRMYAWHFIGGSKNNANVKAIVKLGKISLTVILNLLSFALTDFPYNKSKKGQLIYKNGGI